MKEEPSQSFSPNSYSSEVWKQHLILHSFLQACESRSVFSSSRFYTFNHATCYTCNTLPHPFMKSPLTSLQKALSAVLPLLFLQGHCSPENLHHLWPTVVFFIFSLRACVFLKDTFLATHFITGEGNQSPTEINGKIPINLNRARILLKVFKWGLSWTSVMQIFLYARANHICCLHLKHVEQLIFSVLYFLLK